MTIIYSELSNKRAAQYYFSEKLVPPTRLFKNERSLKSQRIFTYLNKNVQTLRLFAPPRLLEIFGTKQVIKC